VAASIPLSAVTNYLKQKLAPNIQDQYAKTTPFLANVKKNIGVEIANNQFIITVIQSIHSGVAAIGRGETLPTGYAATNRVTIAPKFLFVGFSVEDQDLQMARSNDLALANLMTINEDQMRTAYAKQLNRMFLDGRGVIATANGAGSGSTTVNVNASTPNGDFIPTKYLAPGMYVKIGSGAAVQVASVVSTTQFTIQAARSWSSSDNIVIVGPDGSTGQEPDGGLFNALATTNNTFQGIDRTANSWWIPQTFTTATDYTTTSRKLEFQLEDLILQCNEYGKVNSMFMNRKAYKRLANDLQSIQRIVGSVELEGGFKGLAFAGPGYDVAAVMDYDVPDGVIYGVDFSSFTQVQLAPLDWLELDGTGNILRLQGKATWEGFLRSYINLGLRQAKSNFALTGGTF
jgi:hypothetical protein